VDREHSRDVTPSYVFSIKAKSGCYCVAVSAKKKYKMNLQLVDQLQKQCKDMLYQIEKEIKTVRSED